MGLLKIRLFSTDVFSPQHMKKVQWTFDSEAENNQKVQWTFDSEAENNQKVQWTFDSEAENNLKLVCVRLNENVLFVIMPA